MRLIEWIKIASAPEIARWIDRDLDAGCKICIYTPKECARGHGGRCLMGVRRGLYAEKEMQSDE